MNFNSLQKTLEDSLQSLKTFDWRSLQKFASPQAADDLNLFLEKLPQNTNQTLLIIAGVAWSAAGAMGLYTTIQMQKFTEIRAELQEAEALQPIVPIVKDVAVNPQEVKDFVEKVKNTYQGIEMRANGPAIVISAKATSQFGQFREAVGHVQNGGSGWRVNIERLCVGRECDRSPLAAALKINKVSVDKPG